MNKRVCIYTAIYGGYDDLKEQPEQTTACDFVCFTDNPDLKAKGWRVRHLRVKHVDAMHPRMQAKYPRTMNHDLFAPPTSNLFTLARQRLHGITRYDYTIWIDGSVKILTEKFAGEMISYVGEYGMAMFIHPDRDCIYDEVDECWDYQKYRGWPLRQQVEHYRSQGYPEHNGLMATGLIVRDMRKEKVRKINEDWWRENVRWTYQDQLSLPYVLWKNNYDYDKINLSLWKNHLFELIPHHSWL